MLRVGIVAEGPSDWMVLEEVMRMVHPDLAFQRLQPNQTLVIRKAMGWKGVRAWCREFGPQLETFMAGASPRLDLLVVHADCSMAHNEGAARPCPPAGDTVAALRDVILAAWLNRQPQPPFLVIATPSKSTDAWAVAALDPPFARLSDIECDFSAEDELARRRLLPWKDGAVKKQAVRYQPLAEGVGSRLDEVCKHCPQAEAFRREFGSAVERLMKGRDQPDAIPG